VTGIGLLHGVDGEGADRIDAKGIDCDLRRLMTARFRRVWRCNSGDAIVVHPASPGR
jgi:hypothetical protein